MQFITRANLTLSNWCRHVGIEFVSEVFSLTKWSKLTPWECSFEFGTYVKFASIESFLNNKSRGDRYIWFDTDIYPTQKAYGWKPSSLPENGFWGWWRHNPEWTSDPNHRHTWGKIAWCKQINDPHFSVGSGIFCLTRRDLQDFWDWLNKDHSINTKQWWQEHYNRLVETDAYVKSLGGVNSHVWMYGLDEHYIEEWVNSSGVVWEEISHDIHAIYYHNPEAILHHYDGQTKEYYPAPKTPNQKFQL